MILGLAPLLDGVLNQTSLVDGVNKIIASSVSDTKKEKEDNDVVDEDCNEKINEGAPTSSTAYKY